MRKIGYHKPFFRKNKLLTVYLDPRGNFISVFIPHQYQNKTKKTFILILGGSFFNNFMKFNKFDEKPQSLKIFRRFEHTPKVLNLRGLVFEQYLFKNFNNAYDISLMSFFLIWPEKNQWISFTATFQPDNDFTVTTYVITFIKFLVIKFFADLLLLMHK